MSALWNLTPPPPRRIVRLGPWRLESAAPQALLLPCYAQWLRACGCRTRESLIHFLHRFGPPGCACAIPRDELPPGHWRNLAAVSAGQLEAMHLALYGRALAPSPADQLLRRALRSAALAPASFSADAFCLNPAEKDALNRMLDALYGCGEGVERLRGSHGAFPLLWCDPATRLPCKTLLDWRLADGEPAALLPVKARSRSELLRLLPAYGWERRAAFALQGSRRKDFFLIAVQQMPPFGVWTLRLHVNSTLIRQGRSQTAFLLRCLREADWPLLPPVLEEEALPVAR